MKRWNKVIMLIVTIFLLSYHIAIAQESQGGSPVIFPFAWHRNLTPEELGNMIKTYMDKYPEFKAAMDKLGLTADKIIEAKRMFESGSYTLEQILTHYGLTPGQIIEVLWQAKKEVAYRKLQENGHFLNMNYIQLKEEMAKRREQWLSNLQLQLGISKEELIEAFESGKSLTEFLKEKGISEEQFHNAFRNLWITR